MNDLLIAVIAARFDRAPLGSVSVHDVLVALNAAAPGRVRRDETIAGLSRAGYRFDVVDRRLAVLGLAAKA